MRRSMLAFVLALGACGSPVAPSDAAGPDAAPADAAAPDAACAAGESTRVVAGRPLVLYVPPGAACDRPRALVVVLEDGDDASGAAMNALADRDGFVVARPSAESAATPWLDAAGAPSSADRAYLEAAVAELGALPSTDLARVHVVGVARGARLAARWLFEGTLVPRGVGLVDYRGPIEALGSPRDFGDRRPRVWASTGARAPGFDAQAALLAALGAAGYGVGDLGARERDTIEGAPPWLYAELWAWLDRAAWPENGPPEQPWVRQRFPWADASMLSIDAYPDGRFVAGSADGRVFDTNASGKWSLRRALGPGALADVVAGTAPIFGSTVGLVTSDDAITFVRGPHDDAPRIGLAAVGARLYGVSFAEGLSFSDDRGAHWTRLGTRTALGAVAASPVTGTVVAVGRGASYVRYVGTPSELASGSTARELHAVACAIDGTWWIVGSEGTVLRSTDDARTFSPVLAPGAELADLYALALDADGAMIAVGARGTVVVSRDGATLHAWPTGGQGYLGAVRWIGPEAAMILGESGLVAVGTDLR